MKARIKSTGEIKDVIAGDIYLEGMGGRSLGINEVEFEVGFDKTDWEALRNQAAIAAMQGLLSAPIDSEYPKPNSFEIAKKAYDVANALVLEIIQRTSNEIANRTVNKMEKLIRELKKWERT